MDYRIKKQNKIVYCIFDNINNQYSASSRETAKNVSDYFLSKTIQNGYDIIIDTSTDKLLKRAASDKFYTHAVVVITGTHLGLSDRLFSSVEQKCKEQFTLAGHVLDRNDAYYEIHNQFFIMNLEEYRRLGSPEMGDVDWNKTHTKIEPIRSEECVRGDTEIPVWIEQGNTSRTYTQQRHGWNFIDIGLKNNAVFCDVGDDIRINKFYLYYEYDHVYLRHVPELFNYTLICNTMVTPWNSDSLPTDQLVIGDPVDHYVTTGTGLNWIHNLLTLGYHDNTKITFTDISYAVLSFMKSLVEEWDGKDYATFYMNQMKFVPDSYNYDLINHEKKIRDWWDSFEQNFDDFQSLWNKVRQLKFDYKLLDYFAPNTYNFLEPNKNTFVNVSDVFNHIPYVNSANVKYRVARENNLIDTLKNIDENIWLFIPSRLGDFYCNKDEINFGKVKDFNLWDINEFNAPPWQEHDWKSYCPMTHQVKILT